MRASLFGPGAPAAGEALASRAPRGGGRPLASSQGERTGRSAPPPRAGPQPQGIFGISIFLTGPLIADVAPEPESTRRDSVVEERRPLSSFVTVFS